MSKLRKEGACNTILDELNHILDHIPIVNPHGVTIYTIPYVPATIFMASFTDGLHITEVTEVAHTLCIGVKPLDAVSQGI